MILFLFGRFQNDHILILQLLKIKKKNNTHTLNLEVFSGHHMCQLQYFILKVKQILSYLSDFLSSLTPIHWYNWNNAIG